MLILTERAVLLALEKAMEEWAKSAFYSRRSVLTKSAKLDADWMLNAEGSIFRPPAGVFLDRYMPETS
jgi:hypothetical protein